MTRRRAIHPCAPAEVDVAEGALVLEDAARRHRDTRIETERGVGDPASVGSPFISSQRLSITASRPPSMAPIRPFAPRNAGARDQSDFLGRRQDTVGHQNTPDMEASLGSHVTCPASMIGVRSGVAVMRNLPISPPRLWNRISVPAAEVTCISASRRIVHDPQAHRRKLGRVDLAHAAHESVAIEPAIGDVEGAGRHRLGPGLGIDQLVPRTGDPDVGWPSPPRRRSRARHRRMRPARGNAVAARRRPPPPRPARWRGTRAGRCGCRW
jgi:hypothetical protein